MTMRMEFDATPEVLVARPEVDEAEVARRQAIAARVVARRVTDPVARAELLQMLGLAAAAAIVAA